MIVLAIDHHVAETCEPGLRFEDPITELVRDVLREGILWPCENGHAAVTDTPAERQIVQRPVKRATMFMEKGLPIVVFDLLGEGNIKSLLQGRRVGTLVACPGWRRSSPAT